MPVSSIGEVLWGRTAVHSQGGAPTISSFGAMNASGDRVAWVIRAPKAGTLHSFEFGIQTVGNNPDSGLRMSFQDVSATTGFPDTSADQFRNLTEGGTITTGWKTPPGALTSDGTDSGTKRTVVAGELVACVVDFVSFVALDSVTVRSGWGVTLHPGTNYCVDGSSGTYSKVINTTPAIALKYDDGTYGVSMDMFPSIAVTTESFSNASTPDERGIKFQVSSNWVTNGAWFFGTPDQDMQVLLYNSADTVIGTATLDKDQLYLTSTPNYFNVRWAEGPLTLQQNADYRLVLKPTTTNAILTYTHDIAAANAPALPMGVAGTLTRTHRTDAGAWTDTTTNWPNIGLLLSGVEMSAGGGGNSGGAAIYNYEG